MGTAPAAALVLAASAGSAVAQQVGDGPDVSLVTIIHVRGSNTDALGDRYAMRGSV